MSKITRTQHFTNEQQTVACGKSALTCHCVHKCTDTLQLRLLPTTTNCYYYYYYYYDYYAYYYYYYY